MDLSHDKIRSVRPGAREIALTFDDGPNPTWTPKILAFLAAHKVPATFFVIGADVVRCPTLVRAELAQGDEVGSMTFTGVDLGSVSRLRANAELSTTQTALAGAGGITTPLLRLPYVSTPSSMSLADYRAAKRAARFGYLVVAANRDTMDWRMRTPSAIAQSALTGGGAAVVQLDDGGRNQAATLAALSEIIAKGRAEGIRFVTVSTVAHLRPSVVDPRASLAAHLQGVALIWATRLAGWTASILTAALVVVGVLSVLRAAAVVLFARHHVKSLGTDAKAFGEELSVSVVVPAYNEEVGIEAAVRSILATEHRHIEVVVVDDGSTDRTAEIVEAIDDGRLKLVRKQNGGKAAALNVGIANSSGEVVVMVDGDTMFEPGTITFLVRRMADRSVGAVSGNTKVGNREGLLGLWQHIEYVIGFNLDRRMYEVLRCMPTVPGAIGAFRREALMEVGLVSTDTLAEDTDLTMAILRAGWKVLYEQDAIAWTEAPGSLRGLWRQRYRWSYGTMQAMWKHRGAISEGSPLGRYGIPYMLAFQVMLPLFAPVIDLFALYGIVFLPTAPILAYWLGFNALQLGISAYAFGLDGESLRPLWAVPLQQFVYRQLMYLVVIQSVISAVMGTRLGWQKIVRRGLGTVGDPAAG